MSDDDTPKYQREEWLREKYHEEGLTQREISELCDCSSTTIGNWMHRLDIETATGPRQTDADTRYQDAEWLREKYHEEGLSQPDIAEMCDCSAATISNWMRKLGIPTDTDRGDGA